MCIRISPAVKCNYSPRRTLKPQISFKFWKRVYTYTYISFRLKSFKYFFFHPVVSYREKRASIEMLGLPFFMVFFSKTNKPECEETKIYDFLSPRIFHPSSLSLITCRRIDGYGNRTSKIWDGGPGAKC